MSPSRPGPGAVPVHFDDALFDGDLKRLPAARKHLVQARKRCERDGISPVEGRRCHGEHHSGTNLPNCVKLYIPGLGGPWRMVFQGTALPDGGVLLEYVAAGLGHTPRQGRRMDVYQVAHHRLYGAWPPR
jgi:hypothetical protein